MWQKRNESERSIAFRNCCVICDEEYKDLCRMTVETCDAGHIAIVCTVYGLMIQSVICEEAEFPKIFSGMKAELAAILEREGSLAEKETAFCDLFARYTTAGIYKQRLLGER